MKVKHIYNWISDRRVASIFFVSAVFCVCNIFFGAYNYTMYSVEWFTLFFVYEIVFFCGLASPKYLSNSRIFGVSKQKRKYSFVVTPKGAIILWISCIVTIISFIYFIYIFSQRIGEFSFGAYTAQEFARGKDFFDKIIISLSQMGGDAAFLILTQDHTKRYKYLKAVSHFTLFLPGLMYLLMGARFLIAVEFLLLVFSKWYLIGKKQKAFFLIIGMVLGLSFLYLFFTRVSVTAIERYLIFRGDMEMKPFWEMLYTYTGNISSLCFFSYYLGQAPYAFAYFCEYEMPDSISMGGNTFRIISQIVNAVFQNDSNNIGYNLGGGRYSGFAFNLISDFGVIGSLFATFLFGRLFRIVECKALNNKVSAVLYPAVKVICFFAPIYYFYVGRIDYTILFCLVLLPFCLRKVADTS